MATLTTNHRLNTAANADAPEGHRKVQTGTDSRTKKVTKVACECGKVFTTDRASWAGFKFATHQRRVSASRKWRATTTNTTPTKKEGTVPVTKKRPSTTAAARKTATKSTTKTATTKTATSRKGKAFTFSKSKEAIKMLGGEKVTYTSAKDGTSVEVFMWQFAGRGVVQVKNAKTGESSQHTFGKDANPDEARVRAVVEHLTSAVLG